MRLNLIKLFVNLHLDKFKLIVNIFLLGVFALIQYYYLDNRFYALFIVFFFLALLIPHRRYFSLLAVSILIITIFNTQMLDTWMKLRELELTTIQAPKSALVNIFTANSGQEVLPIQVQHMLTLLHNNHINSYQLSNQFVQDPTIDQRIIESAWPIKMENTSYYYLISSNEIKNYAICSIIDQREDVTFAECH